MINDINQQKEKGSITIAGAILPMASQSPDGHDERNPGTSRPGALGFIRIMGDQLKRS